MAWPPVAAKLVVNVALPPVPTATVPRITLPSLNVTVPVGVPAPGATAATLAVKVTAWPVTAGLTDDPRVSVVAARLTVTATAAESLAAKPLTPKKEAVSAWVPTNSDVGSRDRRAERRRRRRVDDRRGGVQQHADAVGGAVGRHQIRSAVAVQVGC